LSEDDLDITLFFDAPLTDIHPSIGVVDGTAYVGVWVPGQVTDKEGHVKNRDFLCLITDKHQQILATPQELAKHHWRLAYKPIHTENRWNIAEVQKWLKGHASASNPSNLFEDILKLYHEFIEFPDEKTYVLHALWSIGTHFHHLFNSFPYLYCGGIKRSGKTKTLTVHYAIDFNCILSGNMSSSSIYRIVQNQRATLAIDETEKLSNPQRAQEFRNILLSGYKKGVKTYRIGKDSKDRLEPESFEGFSPKLLANIGGLGDVLEDRCIFTFQRRSLNKAILNKEIDFMQPRFAELRGRLYMLFLTHWQTIVRIYAEISECSELGELVNLFSTPYSELPDGKQYVYGRELELWRPLLALARFFDTAQPTPENTFTSTLSTLSSLHSTAQPAPETSSPSTLHSLSSLMLDYACTMAKQRHTENTTETGDEILIGCLLKIVDKEQKTDYVKVKEIHELMVKQFEDREDWLTNRWIGSALRRLGFIEKRRVGSGYEYKISYSDLEDLKKRMQIEDPEPEEPEKPAATTCWICMKPLPKDHVDTTISEGKEVHTVCYRQMTDGRKTPGDM
jgi:hypothetical protein